MDYMLIAEVIARLICIIGHSIIVGLGSGMLYDTAGPGKGIAFIVLGVFGVVIFTMTLFFDLRDYYTGRRGANSCLSTTEHY